MKGDHIRVVNVTAFRYAFWAANLYGIYGITTATAFISQSVSQRKQKVCSPEVFDIDVNYLEPLPRERPLLT